MPGTYTRSNGETVEVDSLDFSHAKAAVAKLRRNDPEGRADEISRLDAHVQLLADRWAAEHPGEQP